MNPPRRGSRSGNAKCARPLLCLHLLAAALLCGCAETAYYEDTAAEEVKSRERKALTPVQKGSAASPQPEASTRELKMKDKRVDALNSKWRQQPFTAVVETFGQPRMLMSTPGGSGSTIAVFGTSDKESKCIDAFAFQTADGGEATVVEYFCR